MPYIEKKKERRIRDKNRMKEKSKRIARLQHSLQYWDELEHCNAWRSTIARRAVVIAERLASCSCFMCGNPRKWFNTPTFAEVKFFQYKRYDQF